MATTTSRLLNLLSLLQTGRDWPGTVLAERLHVSHRTVRRDIQRLRDMGYRFHTAMGPDGGYRLDAGSELPPLLFDDEQVIALTVALQAAVMTGAGIEEAAQRALNNIRQVLPARLRNRVGGLPFDVVPPAGTGPAAALSPGLLPDLSRAVRAREVLRFDYASHRSATREPEAPRRVEPHHLVASNGRWYLVAWDLDHDDWRLFRADRMSLRTPTGPGFTPREVPGGSVGDFVSARFKGSTQANAWPCVGTVVLRRPASAIAPFAGDGTLEALGPHQCLYTAGSWSWIALAASLNRFDTDITVVGPPELTEAFARLAARNTATATGTS
ncbi:WYL domain-containing protein [Streptomyces sp. ARC32]